MKTAVISYSYSGNNGALAANIAGGLRAEIIKVIEPKKRTYGTIAADILFNRTPKTSPEVQVLSSYDLVVFVAPVWMGQPAFPLRSYLKYIKNNQKKYAFVSISGGGLNPNPGLKDAIVKRTGIEPIVLIDMHIADLLPAEPKPTEKETGAYKLTEEDVAVLSGRALTQLRKHLGYENS